MSDQENLYWFESKGEGQELVTITGKRIFLDEKSPYCNKTAQQQAGWQRASLYMEYHGIWDATQFACEMEMMPGAGPFINVEGEKYGLVFATPQKAEEYLYPAMTEEQVDACRAYVDAFYADPGLQLLWHPLLLRPVCLYIDEDKTFHPVNIADYDPRKVLFKIKGPTDPLGSMYHCIFGGDTDDVFSEIDIEYLSHIDGQIVERGVDVLTHARRQAVLWRGRGSILGEYSPSDYFEEVVDCLGVFRGCPRSEEESLPDEQLAIESMNPHQLADTLDNILAGERFCDGYIADLIEDDTLLRIMKRLKTLLEIYEMGMGRID